MNYWPRWIRAIRGKTLTLSMAQMGAYDRLLDYYYEEERSLPAELDACYRIAGAMSKQDRADVAFVLGKFFTLTDAGYSQERADSEILYAIPKIAAAHVNGKLGGRPKGSKNKPSGLLEKTPEEPKSKAPHPQPHSGEEPKGSPPPAGDTAELPAAFAPTASGTLCRALKRAGIANVSPSHPSLLALLGAGATEGEFLAFAEQALTKRDPFSYLLTVVQSQREKAADMAARLYRGELPAAETPYQRSMRERMEQASPLIAAKRPGAAPAQNPMEILDGLVRIAD